MNEQAMKLLTTLVEKATTGIDAAVNFSQAQIPDVIKQLLIWKMSVSLLWMLLAVVVAVVTVIMCRAFLQHGKKIQSNIDFIRDLRARYTNGEISYSQYDDMKPGEFDDEASTDRKIKCAIFSACTAILGLVIFISVVDFDWLKIWIAPKFYLVEYAATLVSK